MNSLVFDSCGPEDAPLWSSGERIAALASALHEQMCRGFVLLHFEPALEAEFRAYLRGTGWLSRLTLLTVALLGMFSTALVDVRWLGLPESAVPLSRGFQFGLMVPLLLIASWACALRRRSRLTDWLLVLMFFGMVTGVMGQRVVDAIHGFFVPLEYSGLCIVAMFALARLRFWIMLPCALAALAAVYANEFLLVPWAPATNYHLFCNTILVMLGVATGYTSEYFIRWTWLNGTLLRQLSRIDGLTGLLNRPALEEGIRRGLSIALREHRAYALALIDIDGFGDYNDHFGHPSGDIALRRVADVLGPHARRPNDVCGRYGGEEFVLLWLDCSAAQAVELAEATRAAVEEIRIAHTPSWKLASVTVSIGVCHVTPGRGDAALEQVLQAADRMLYAAKFSGRNCVRSTVFDRQS